jgi:mannose-6-phosphate isomerase-like protein (cupin superfamily)
MVAPPVQDFDGAFQTVVVSEASTSPAAFSRTVPLPTKRRGNSLLHIAPATPTAGAEAVPDEGGSRMAFESKRISSAPDAMAPDGSEVRILCQVERGSMAHFTLPPRAVSRAMAHRTVEEVWFFLSGLGRMWRRLGGREETIEVGPGTSISIPAGTHFQFRSDAHEPLAAIGATMPPWPGEDEAYAVDGPWQATV